MLSLGDFDFKRVEEQDEVDTVVAYRCPARDYDVIVWALSSSLEHDKHRPISDFVDGTFNIKFVDKNNLGPDYYTYFTVCILAKYNINNYHGHCTGNMLLQILKAVEAYCADNNKTVPNICAKCGVRDEYAAYCEKYGEVRCYLHC